MLNPDDKTRASSSLVAERSALKRTRPIPAHKAARVAEIEAELIHRGWTECPYPTCSTLKDRELFACGYHWRTLPSWIRRSISAAWQRFQLDPVGRIHELQTAQQHAFDHWSHE